jgi:hypothetical protein
MVVYILTFKFLDSKWEDRIYQILRLSSRFKRKRLCLCIQYYILVCHLIEENHKKNPTLDWTVNLGFYFKNLPFARPQSAITFEKALGETCLS